MDVDFWVEVSGKGLIVIIIVVIYNIKVVYFVKIMFCSICGINVCYIRIEVIV